MLALLATLGAQSDPPKSYTCRKLRQGALLMDTVVTCTVNGFVLSSVYILVALGFALQLSIMGIFNFAHGAIYMSGAYVTYIFSQELGINAWASLLLSVIIVGAAGILLERYCFRPYLGKPEKQ